MKSAIPIKSQPRRGAVAMLLPLVLTVLVGVGALALNLTWLSSHQTQLRQASEAAALAGAAQLLDPAPDATPSAPDPAAAARVAAATVQAKAFFAANSAATLQTTSGNPDIVAGWSDDPTVPHGLVTPWTGVGPVNALSVRGIRRRNLGQGVLLWFGGLLGHKDAEPAAAATASMDQRICGFRPVGVVNVPMVPLLVAPTDQWPSSVPGTATGLPDHYAVAPRTGTVGAGPDGVAEIALHVAVPGDSLPPGEANARWLALPAAPVDFASVGRQIAQGLSAGDLAAAGGELVLDPDDTVLSAADSAPNASETAALRTALLAIRGQKRIWPIGNLVTVGDETSCQVTGFVAGCVVDCTFDGESLDIVVQACTIQTCTGVLRSGMARNPWIGKLILNE
jgi:hypothetical protein